MHHDDASELREKIDSLTEKLSDLAVVIARIDERIALTGPDTDEQLRAVRREISRIKKFSIAAVFALLATGGHENISKLLALLF